MRVSELIEKLLELPLDAYVEIVGDRQEPDVELVYSNPIVLTDNLGCVLLVPDYLVEWIRGGDNN